MAKGVNRKLEKHCWYLVFWLVVDASSWHCVTVRRGEVKGARLLEC